MPHSLADIEGAVAAVRALPDDGSRYTFISKLLAGPADHITEEGRVLGTQRARFCSAVSNAKLWPERKK